MPEPRCRWEARPCRAPFLESGRGPEAAELGSDTGTDTGTEGNRLEGSGLRELFMALRNCRHSAGDSGPLPTSP